MMISACHGDTFAHVFEFCRGAHSLFTNYEFPLQHLPFSWLPGLLPVRLVLHIGPHDVVPEWHPIAIAANVVGMVKVMSPCPTRKDTAVQDIERQVKAGVTLNGLPLSHACK